MINLEKYERRDPVVFCRNGTRHKVETTSVFDVRWKSCSLCGEWLGWVKEDE
jgi:hypothetical protein